MIKKYKKKPISIEAIQFTPETRGECAEWLGENLIINIKTKWVAVDGEVVGNGEIARSYQIKTLEGDPNLIFGDYIIKGVKGEFYPCKEEIFNMTYEEIIPQNKEN